jgi:hypothetical protein
MWRITVTSSFNEISTDQLGNRVVGGGGGEALLLPPPTYCRRLLDRYLKGTKVGQNWYQSNRKGKLYCRQVHNLTCPKGHHHERSINVLGGCSTF